MLAVAFDKSANIANLALPYINDLQTNHMV